VLPASISVFPFPPDHLREARTLAAEKAKPRTKGPHREYRSALRMSVNAQIRGYDEGGDVATKVGPIVMKRRGATSIRPDKFPQLGSTKKILSRRSLLNVSRRSKAGLLAKIERSIIVFVLAVPSPAPATSRGSGRLPLSGPEKPPWPVDRHRKNSHTCEAVAQESRYVHSARYPLGPPNTPRPPLGPGNPWRALLASVSRSSSA
jgi:hypothetical protein